MTSLHKCLDFIAAQKAALLNQRHELEQLREQVRIAEGQKPLHQTLASPGLYGTLRSDKDHLRYN